MATFEGVLASIPGYGGYLAKESYNRDQSMGDLKQMGALQGLMAQMRAQQQQESVRGLLSSGKSPEEIQQGLMALGDPGLKTASTLAQLQNVAAQEQERRALAEHRGVQDQKARAEMADLQRKAQEAQQVGSAKMALAGLMNPDTSPTDGALPCRQMAYVAPHR